MQSVAHHALVEILSELERAFREKRRSTLQPQLEQAENLLNQLFSEIGLLFEMTESEQMQGVKIDTPSPRENPVPSAVKSGA